MSNSKQLIELAKLLKDRENPAIQGASVGTVVIAPPDLKITVNEFLLDSSRLVVAKHLLTAYTTGTADVGDHGSHSHTLSDILKVGDQVIVIPSIDNMTYYVTDKVGDI